MSIRIIPCLLLQEERLVKTVQFRRPAYIGDPVNTVRIFNELEVDELCFLDIGATIQKKEPAYALLQQISDECFMPLAYGGGIDSMQKAQAVFRCGFEKIVVNTAAIRRLAFVSELADRFGSQSIVVSIDVEKNFLGQHKVVTCAGKEKTALDPLDWALEVQNAGAGEVLLTTVYREGTWKGFDVPLVKRLAESLDIPLIAQGGAGSVDHINELVKQTQVSAIGLGSMLVYQKKDKGVLINFPKEKMAFALQKQKL